MKQYILDRAKEPSTWRGAILFLTAIGVPIAPAMAEHIVTVGLGIAGLIGMASKG
ncbi:MAG: hypothetical protein ACR2JS_03645 [Candidatus Nanopelagicales bacterium]